MQHSKPSLSHNFVFLTAVIVLLLIAASMTYETYLEHYRRVAEQMDNEATRIDRALILEIEHSSHLIQGIGQEITHIDAKDLNAIAYLLRSFDTTATIHHVFSWIDANGNNVVSSNKGAHAPVDVSDRDYVKSAISTPWKIQVGDPIQGRVSAKWALPVALGITDATGKYMGTVVISMDIYTLTRDLQRAVKESGISCAIYSKSFLPLTQSAAEDKLDAYGEKLKAVNFAMHPSGVISKPSLFDHNAMYVYYTLSPTYPYIIVLALDNAMRDKAFKTLLIPRLIEILLISIFMLTLLWLVRTRIIKPVAELTHITSDMARGAPYREPAKGIWLHELYALAQQIRRLNDYLEETRRIEEESKNKNSMLKYAKEAADLNNRIKIEFLASMSHELRTPLNTIIGFSEIMKEQNYDGITNKHYKQYIQDILDAGRHLQNLTDDMLKLSHAITKTEELQEKHIDVRFILSKCLRALGKTLEEHKLHIELKLPELMPHLLMDEPLLEQVIINLLCNIIRDSNAASNIIIRAVSEQDNKGVESFCISLVETKPEAESKVTSGTKAVVKHDTSHIGIPLIRALLTMHQVMLEIKVIGRQNIITLRFPKEKMVA